MYTFESRVRYSETDEYGRLTVLGIINYMQDCSTFQSEDRHVGVAYLDENHKAWLLSSWRILIDRYPRLGERLIVGTWPTSFKGIYGYRNFVLRDLKGQDLVRAESVWFLYDTEKNQPIRVQEGDVAPYGTPEPALVMEPAPKKILTFKEPGTYEEGTPIQIARHHLDTNHHVNNARYVDMAREALPKGHLIREIRADYKKAAVLGDILIPHVTRTGEDAWTVSLCGKEEGKPGDIYAAVWLKTEQDREIEVGK